MGSTKLQRKLTKCSTSFIKLHKQAEAQLLDLHYKIDEVSNFPPPMAIYPKVSKRQNGQTGINV